MKKRRPTTLEATILNLRNTVMTVAYEAVAFRNVAVECRNEMRDLQTRMKTMAEKAENLENQLVEMHLQNQRPPRRKTRR